MGRPAGHPEMYLFWVVTNDGHTHMSHSVPVALFWNTPCQEGNGSTTP